jgi:hypothetical protein
VNGLLIGGGWRGRLNRRRTATSSATVYAVRRDWPDGTHEFHSRRGTEAAAARAAERDQAYWRPGPMRPRLSLVTIGKYDFELHARHRLDCKAPDGPSAVMAASGAEVQR